MIGVFRQEAYYRIFFLLGVMSMACFALSLFRVYLSGSGMYLFMNWNLFLAFLPMALSTWLWSKPQYHANKSAMGILLFTWLLFFPNAPYMLTDLFHLRHSTFVPIWYDLVLILSFAWTGLLFGFISLMHIEQFLDNVMSRRKVMVTIVFLLFLSAFGIYLGRYLRWNSWDILGQPGALLADLTDRVVNPFSHPRTWGLTLFMGGLLNMMYWSFKFLRTESL